MGLLSSKGQLGGCELRGDKITPRLPWQEGFWHGLGSWRLYKVRQAAVSALPQRPKLWFLPREARGGPGRVVGVQGIPGEPPPAWGPAPAALRQASPLLRSPRPQGQGSQPTLFKLSLPLHFCQNWPWSQTWAQNLTLPLPAVNPGGHTTPEPQFPSETFRILFGSRGRSEFVDTNGSSKFHQHCSLSLRKQLRKLLTTFD